MRDFAENGARFQTRRSFCAAALSLGALPRALMHYLRTVIDTEPSKG
jgi:hypothetical protein